MSATDSNTSAPAPLRVRGYWIYEARKRAEVLKHGPARCPYGFR
jgi:hypothetical protein